MPTFRVLVPFLLGILVEDSIQYIQTVCGYHVFIVLIFFFIAMVLFRSMAFSRRYWFGVVLSCFFFLSGSWHTALYRVVDRPSSYLKVNGPIVLVGRTCSVVKSGKRSNRVIVDVVRMFTGVGWQEAQGNVYVFANSRVLQQGLPFGTMVMMKITPVPLNPSDTGFPSALFLRRQVLAKAWVKDTIVVLPEERNPGVRTIAMRWRARVADLFVSHFPDQRIAAVATALVVGEELPIDQELSRAYSVSGTLHILCVSGMHVGLVYVMLAFVLKSLRRHALLKHLYYPIVITLVWAYALLAGASPSVVRASVMCSILLLSEWLNRKGVAYNTLAGSFFVMVIADPFQLFEPGLQLSFLAVLGIVWLSKMITAWWQPGSWLVYQGWTLLSVSLSAQIMTMPVALCYFGQFPNYFLLSNLVVVPVTTMAIYGCIFQLALSVFPPVVELMIQVNSALIRLSNAFVIHMENWPYVISRWEIGWVDVFWMYVLIVLAVHWFRTAAFQTLLRVLLVAILWSLTSISQTS